MLAQPIYTVTKDKLLNFEGPFPVYKRKGRHQPLKVVGKAERGHVYENRVPGVKELMDKPRPKLLLLPLMLLRLANLLELLS